MKLLPQGQPTTNRRVVRAFVTMWSSFIRSISVKLTFTGSGVLLAIVRFSLCSGAQAWGWLSHSHAGVATGGLKWSSIDPTLVRREPSAALVLRFVGVHTSYGWCARAISWVWGLQGVASALGDRRADRADDPPDPCLQPLWAALKVLQLPLWAVERNNASGF